MSQKNIFSSLLDFRRHGCHGCLAALKIMIFPRCRKEQRCVTFCCASFCISRIFCTTFGFVATMAAMAGLPMCAGVQTDNSACSNNGQNRRVYGETYALVRIDIHKQGNRHTCGWEGQVLQVGKARSLRQVRHNWATSLTVVFRRTTIGNVAGRSTEKKTQYKIKV